MTNLTNLAPSQSYGDIITTDNNGLGLDLDLRQVQDGLGHASPMSLSTVAVNFDRGAGQTFQIDTVPLTADVANINLMAAPNPIATGVGSFTLPRGTTAQRPVIAVSGMIRYNTDINQIEVFEAPFWVQIGDEGNVTGPIISTIDAVARYGDVNGRTIKDSVIEIDDAGKMTGCTELQAGGVKLVNETFSTLAPNSDITFATDGTGDFIIETEDGNINISSTGIGNINISNPMNNLDNINIRASKRINFFNLPNTQSISLQAPPALLLSAIYTFPDFLPTEVSGFYLTSDELGNMNWSFGVTSFQNLVFAPAHGFVAGNVLRKNGAVYALAQADTEVNSQVVGYVSRVVNVNTFYLGFGGRYITSFGVLAPGTQYYLDPVVPGAITPVKPLALGQVVKPLLISDLGTAFFWQNQLGIVN